MSEEYTYKQAREHTLLKWRWFPANIDDNLHETFNSLEKRLLEAIPELIGLTSSCGFCTYFFETCDECPMLEGGKDCTLYGSRYSNFRKNMTKNNAQKVLELVEASPYEDIHR